MHLLMCGLETRNFPIKINFEAISIGNASISCIQLIIAMVSLVLMVALTLFIRYTKPGMAMRATAQDPKAACLMGVDVDFIISLTFFLGSGLAAVAGILIGMYYQAIDPGMGFMAGLKAFSAAVLGGIEILPGAILGGLVIGIAETVAAGYIHAGFRDAIAFAILIAVLLIRPEGLMFKQWNKKV